MSMLDEIRERLGNLRQASAKYSVHCDETGLTQIAQKGDTTQARHMVWDEVTMVFAYKRDCFAVDQIRVVVAANRTDWIEVTEDDEGYKCLIEQMPARIAGCPALDEWWDRVALPPFETQWTQIYTRQREDIGQ
jgi:hypothetical protein